MTMQPGAAELLVAMHPLLRKHNSLEEENL